MNENLSSSVQPLNVLLVEGDGDIHIFGSLLNYYQVIDDNYHLSKRSDRHFKLKDEHFDMQEQEGIDGIIKLLGVELKASFYI